MQIFQTTRLKLKNRKGLFLLRFLIASILVLIIVILLIFERKEKRNSQIKHKKLNSDREFNLAKDSIKSLENQKKVSLFISENTDKKNQLENLNSNKIFENVSETDINFTINQKDIIAVKEV